MEYGTIEKNNELNVGARRFIFDTVISEEYTRQADITDQYVENNSTIQDHYAIKPAELTIKGFVAEVTYQREDSQFLEEELKKAQEEAKVSKNLLKIATTVCPTVSNYMNIATGAYDYVSDSVKKIANVFPQAEKVVKKLKETGSKIKNKFVKNKEVDTTKDATSSSGNNQQLVANLLNEYMENREPVQWRNSYGEFQDYYILDFSFSQENSTYASELTIRLKKINFVETVKTNVDYSTYFSITAQQNAEIENKGNTQGEFVHTSNKYDRIYGANRNATY